MNHIILLSYHLVRQAVRPIQVGLIMGLLVGMLLAAGVWAADMEDVPVSIQVEQMATDEPSRSTPVVVLWIDVAEGYHAYAHDEPAGRPLHADAETVPPTDLRPKILYPHGMLKSDPLNPEQNVRILAGRFPVFICPEPSVDGKWPSQLTVQISMLLCSASRCVPWDQKLQIALKPLAELPDMALFPDVREAFFNGVPGKKNMPDRQSMEQLPALSAADSLAFLGESKTSSMETPGMGNNHLLQTVTDFDTTPFTPRSVQQKLEPGSLGPALVFGVMAGLLLNIMPCVLPVLTIKITGLLTLGSNDELAGRKRRFRRYTLGFAAGILVWFACLAVLMRVAGLAWGGLFQVENLVFGLMVLVFLLALSLFDVFVLPVPGIRLSHKQEQPSGVEAFLFGMTVTLLATPCSGPLLGGVLAWSAVQASWVQVGVIMAAGIGMAMPYLLMSLWPDIAGRLPRPGAWMQDVERLAGFFLMGTVIYLLSILPDWQWLAALVTLLITAGCAWIWGRWASLDAPRIRRVTISILCLACLAGTVLWALTPPQRSVLTWQPFVNEVFSQKLGKEAMLVEFTADWCPTCKVLERTVLSPETLQPLVERYHLQLIRVDLTRKDPDSEAFLRALGSVSIPLLAVFPTGKQAYEPLLLRDLFTADQLESLVKLACNKE